MVTAELELTIGTVVDHRYQIQRVLGHGGFGRTYLAADARRFGELCVLKEFIPRERGDSVFGQKLRELFLREAAILHRLDHPQIPKFFASFEQDSRLFIVQEYVDGKTYWEALRERQQQGRAFTQVEVVQWLKDLLRVLNYVHSQRIVHRDISPDNIMLPKGKNLPVLIDFGVVKQFVTHLHGVHSPNGDGLIEASVSVGKFGYAPYEQIRMGQCSSRSDIYALGVTAVVLLTGRSPSMLIDSKSLDWQWHLYVDVDSRFAQILHKMMAEKPQDRYASAQEVFQDLRLLGNFASTQPMMRGGTSKRPTKLVNLHLVQTIADAPSLPAQTETRVETQVQPEWSSTKLTGADLSSSLVAPVPSLEIAVPSSPLISDNLPARNNSQSSEVLLPKRKFNPSVSLVLMISSLTLLPIAGGFLGMQSPYITSICRILNNCAQDQKFGDRYQQVIEDMTAARQSADNAKTLEDLQRARDRLYDGVGELQAISPNVKVYKNVQQVLPEYSRYLQALDERLARQTRATDLINRAATTAQTAQEQMKLASTAQDYVTIQQQWRRAIATLQAIPPDTFVAQQAVERVRQYSEKIDELSKLITAQGHIPDTATPFNSDGWTFIPQGQPTHSSATPARSPNPTSRPTTPTSSRNASAARPTQAVNQRPVQVSRSVTQSRVNRRTSVSSPRTTRQPATRSVALVATQTMNNVSIRLNGASISSSGTLVANLVIENQSDRLFGFVPLFARVQDANGQIVRSRITITNSRDNTVAPGGVLRGQIYLFGRTWNPSGNQNMTLVIQEGTTGSRSFRISF